MIYSRVDVNRLVLTNSGLKLWLELENVARYIRVKRSNFAVADCQCTHIWHPASENTVYKCPLGVGPSYITCILKMVIEKLFRLILMSVVINGQVSMVILSVV